MKKDFIEHFYMLSTKLRLGENFAFSRFSDGEMYLLMDRSTTLDIMLKIILLVLVVDVVLVKKIFSGK